MRRVSKPISRVLCHARARAMQRPNAKAWLSTNTEGVACIKTKLQGLLESKESDKLIHESLSYLSSKEIDQPAIDVVLQYLSYAANSDIPDAQFQLGVICFDENDDEEQEKELDLCNLDQELSAAMQKQYLAQQNVVEDIKTIRKRAQKHFHEYLRSEKEHEMSKKAVDRIVTRVTHETLDHVYGDVPEALFNPDHALEALPTLDLRAMENRANRKLTHRDGVEWIRRAAENGHADACVLLGNICMQREMLLVQYAIHWYEQVALSSNGQPVHVDALYNLGMIYYEGNERQGIPVDLKRAVWYFEKAAQEGDPSAEFWMGHCYRVGMEEADVAMNWCKAEELLHKAAIKGHSGAQYYLALLYRSGDPELNLASDQAKFWEFLEKAAALDHPEALFCIGEAYYHGSEGVAVNLEKALNNFKRAAELGDADALCSVGSMYYNGIHVSQDFPIAFRYYQEAANRHSMAAWKNLARMHYLGQGTAENKHIAESIRLMIAEHENK